jgi:MFS family permease
MAQSYGEFLRSPHAKFLLAANLLGRLPAGMVPLGIVLFLRAHQVGFGAVGAITAVYGLSAAVGGPLLGRMVDRFGQPAVLAAGGLCSAAGLVGVAAFAPGRLGIAAAAACVAGFCNPPLEPCVRALWPTVLPSARAIVVAYTLDASLQQVVFVLGPALVVVIAAVVSPAAALPITAAALVLGTGLYLRPEPVRRWRAEPRHPHWAGPLRSATIRRLLASMSCVGLSLGALSIAAVAYQEHVRHSGISGAVLGVNAFGALVGSFAYGARPWRLGLEKQLIAMQVAAAVLFLPLALILPIPLTLLFVLCGGAFLSPLLNCAFTITAQAAPRGSTTEAFAWLVSSIGLGTAAGSSLAGILQQHAGLRATWLLQSTAFLLAALLAARIAPVGAAGLADPEATTDVIER